MNQLDSMRIFSKAAECLNFADAARQLGISNAVVTRSVATLETSAVLSKLDCAIAAIEFLLLTRWKVPPLAVVVLCPLAGIGEATWH
jgi:chromate transporter